MLQIAILVGAFLLMAALTPKAPRQKPPAFADFEFPLCKEGEPKTAVFGQVWTKSWMVLTVGNYRTRKKKIGGGKK
ncbi:hypothetical protein ACFSB1_01080 [Halopseudomonas phragmitis]|uniref:Uncharacterized protein n=1 Tax=Halopseudomonas phragmitis TaxID=1931241 RepID=A0A1V0B6M0_9GAMM|nr:hypothetical protein [Halopseudomonas phragmitis]AQZ95568.1 hypothetical protein BVH74_12770 [Halopseudomonas phragmitis]